MNLAFLGAAGSGKGTQAQRLEAEFGLRQISTGDLLREAVRNGTELGTRADPLMKQGKLVPDEIVIGMIAERLAASDLGRGVLLDGFPRTLPQALALDGVVAGAGMKLDRVLVLEVPAALLTERITGRRSCPKDGSVFHVRYQPPARAGVCDKCSGDLVQRSDDTPEKLANRLRVFETDVPAVRAHYARAGLLSAIDGVGTPDEVYARIRAACVFPTRVAPEEPPPAANQNTPGINTYGTASR